MTQKEPEQKEPEQKEPEQKEPEQKEPKDYEEYDSAEQWEDFEQYPDITYLGNCIMAGVILSALVASAIALFFYIEGGI